MTDLLTTTARSTQRFMSEIAARPPLTLDFLDRTGRATHGRSVRLEVWDGARWRQQVVETSTDLIEIDYATLEQRILGWFS